MANEVKMARTLKPQINDLHERLPREREEEVLDFLARLVSADEPVAETAQASEAVLGRDWLTPEEDAAWAHL